MPEGCRKAKRGLSTLHFYGALRPQKPEGLLGTGRRGGKGVRRWGEREIIYLSLHCDHQNDSWIKMGNDESHFNHVS